jgi:hypothetical protein
MSKGKISKGKMSKMKNVERKNVENAKMSLLASNDFCSYYFSRIFFRLLLKSFRRLANSFPPIDYCMNEYSRTSNRQRKQTKKEKSRYCLMTIYISLVLDIQTHTLLFYSRIRRL